MSAALANKIDILKDRAKMLFKARHFFEMRNVMEVDCPSLTKKPSIDVHIDLMEVTVNNNEEGYLHSSPEYLMKRLLSQKIGDIYYLGHVFRKEEEGHLHNPEFTMIEWYRKDISFSSFLDEVIALISLFLPSLPVKIASYRETFCTFTQIDYINVSNEDLYLYIQKNIPISFDIKDFDKDDLLHLIFSHVVEPHLGKNEFFVLTDFPASQAALSKIIQKGDEKVAKRFEVFYECIELANGYHELIDPIEQKNRLIKENEERVKRGKKSYSIDEKFIHALENMGDYHGVSIGFDRLMMLKNNCNDIDQVLSFSWKNL